MRITIKNNSSNWFYRPLLLVIFVALFFSLSMTWVEMDPINDHQKNLEILRSNQTQLKEIENDNVVETQGTTIVHKTRVRHTDGIVFGSSVLVVIIVGGVIANIRKL